MKKMEEIEAQMGEAKGIKKETKRLKNMLSAYESRLLKRAKYEDLNEHLEIRNAQIASILKILKEDLPKDKFISICRRITAETPKMVAGSFFK